MKLLLSIFIFFLLAYGQIYNTRAPWVQILVDSSFNSSYISCSADGMSVLCAGVGTPRRSADYGITWSSVMSTGTWTGCAVSGAKKYQFLCKFNDSIYISKDSGVTWMAKRIDTGVYAYNPLCSYFGNKISVSGGSATAQGTKIYVSNDSGNTWSQTYTFDNSFIIPCGSTDSTGVYQIILLYNDSVFISKDSGTTFSLLFYKPGHTRGIYSSGISYNRKYISLGCGYVGAVAGKMYYSSDTGNTFDSSFQTTSGLGGVVSGDGRVTFAQACGDGYLISVDFGMSWLWVEKISDGGGIVWTKPAISRDGTFMYLMQNTYCKVHRNQLIQPQRYQQTITIKKEVFGETDNNFLYTLPTSVLSSVFKSGSASDRRDIYIYNSFGERLKNEVFANGNFIRWLDTAKTSADRVFTFKSGAGDILAYDSTMYLDAGCATMFHCEDSSTTTIDATGQYSATNISTRNQAGKLGQCYYFTWDSIPDNMNRIYSPGACNYDLDKPFSVSLWLKRKILCGGTGSAIVSRINAAATRGWEIAAGDATRFYKVEWDYFSSGGATIKAQYIYWDSTHNWEKMTFVYNPTGNVMQYYRDGSLVTWTGGYGSIAGTAAPSTRFSVGTTRGTGYTDSTWFDEVRVDSIVLSANQVLSYYRFDNLDSILKYIIVDSSTQYLIPVIDSIRPSSGRPGDTITVYGKRSGFLVSGVTVRFSLVSGTVTSQTDSTIRVIVPPISGIVDIIVKNSSDLTDTLISGFWLSGAGSSRNSIRFGFGFGF